MQYMGCISLFFLKWIIVVRNNKLVKMIDFRFPFPFLFFFEIRKATYWFGIEIEVAITALEILKECVKIFYLSFIFILSTPFYIWMFPSLYSLVLLIPFLLLIHMVILYQPLHLEVFWGKNIITKSYFFKFRKFILLP